MEWNGGQYSGLGLFLIHSSSGCCLIVGSLWNVSVCFLWVWVDCLDECLGCFLLAGPPPTHWSRRAPYQMRLSDFSSMQTAQVRTGNAVSAIRPKTTAHSLVKKSSLPDAACLCRQIAMTGVAPAAWAIVLLVPPPPQGLPSQCNRHRCEREAQSLLFLQRPPPTHRSIRAPCQMRLTDFSSVQAAQVQTGRTVSATRSKTTAHPLVKKSSVPYAAQSLLFAQ